MWFFAPTICVDGIVLFIVVVFSIIRRLLHMPSLRYVDDLFGPGDPASAAEARALLLEVLMALGFTLDVVKTPVPGPSLPIRGVTWSVKDTQNSVQLVPQSGFSLFTHLCAVYDAVYHTQSQQQQHH